MTISRCQSRLPSLHGTSATLLMAVACVLVFLAPSSARSQPATPATAPARAPTAAVPSAPLTDPGPAAAPGDQRIERLSFEDAGARVDEVRVGGQTQSLTVQPKSGAPAYEIQPDNGQRSRGATRGDGISSPGQRVWNVLKF